MITFKGEVVFKNGKSVTINREVAHNGDLPYVVIEETIKMFTNAGSNRRSAIMETCILLDYDESTVRRAMQKLGI